MSSRFKHYHRPTVADDPELVETCSQWLAAKNYAQVAQLARTRGLPPHLRLLAWPLLLANHPYVKNPCLTPDYPSDGDDITSHVTPSRRKIKSDLARARQRSRASPPPKSCDENSLENNITNNNNNDRSASIPRSSISVGRSTSEVTLTKSNPVALIKHATTFTSSPSADSSNDAEDSIDIAIIDAILAFIAKWGKYAPYDLGMVYVALALTEWVDPTELANLPRQEEEEEHTFAQLLENALLVLLHGPPKLGDGPSGPCDSPLAQQISFFLGAFRKLLPELKDHFDDEELLGLGGDEWLLWWIKWAGARVWHPVDRARAWDMYFGWTLDAVSTGDRASDNTNDDASFTSSSSTASVSPFWGFDPNAPILDMHTQHIFVCLAALKSKRGVLMELDQSEIRQFLARFAKFDDTESIIAEAGEIWRSWHWIEEGEVE